MQITVKVKLLENGKNLPLPAYATDESAGVDLLAANNEDIILMPLERKLIPTGIAIELPKNYEAQIRPRSGLAFKNGITVLNSPGTIDSDYRGEISVLLINFGQKEFTISRGMRIAQMIISNHAKADFKIEEDLEDSKRGEGGFGSTGVHSQVKTEETV